MESVYSEKTFKAWMQHQFERDELADMVNHGVNAGFNGLIYYTETMELYQQFYKDIWKMLNEEADNQGISPLKMMADFGGAESVCNRETFENLLVWFCAEKQAYDIIQANDDEEEELS